MDERCSTYPSSGNCSLGLNADSQLRSSLQTRICRSQQHSFRF